MNRGVLVAVALAAGGLGGVYLTEAMRPAPVAQVAQLPAAPVSTPVPVAAPSVASVSATASSPVAVAGVSATSVVPADTLAAASALAPEKKPDAVRVLIAAEGESVLAAQMAGRIINISAKLGDRVRQGESIVRFDCDEQYARLNMAKAEYDGAQKVYESKTKLQAMQSASLLEVSQAAAEVEKFKAQIQLIQAQIRLCSINAPFSGRVTKLKVKPFESVVVGQQLVEVINDERLKVQLNIPSLWLAQVKVNKPFNVRIDETGKTYEARVRRINGKVDAVSQSVEIEGELVGRPDDLSSGMSGVALFPDLAQDAR